MKTSANNLLKTLLVWSLLAVVISVPFFVAAVNPLQGSRNIAYVVGGLSGVIALGLLLLQPLLVTGWLPGLLPLQARRWHLFTGFAIVCTIIMHIVGLYLTSPDDMTDALLLRAPTAFSIYGGIALWAIALTVVLIFIRNKKWVRNPIWKCLHHLLALVIVVASVVHGLMIEGAMGSTTKLMLCVGILVVNIAVAVYLRLLRHPQ